MSPWLVLVVRLAVAIHVVAGGLAVLAGHPLAGTWLPAHAGARVTVYAVVLVIAGLATAAGVQTRRAATAIAATLVVLVIEWMVADRLHNTMNHLLPLFAEASLVILLADRGAPLGIDRWRAPAPCDGASTVTLLARCFLGAIFIAQGASAVFETGVVTFAREVYVAPLAGSWVPAPMLWVAGLLDPPVQLLGGVLFVLGLFTRQTAVVLGLFLCSILFGHVLSDPFDRGPDVHSYALANLVLVAGVLALVPRGNRFSLDAMRRPHVS
jgi:uncharacterized membrane protein YphA (DoxX/SURF4 family)